MKAKFKEQSVTTDASRGTAVAAGVIYGKLSGSRLFRAFTSKRYITIYDSATEKHFYPMKNSLFLLGVFWEQVGLVHLLYIWLFC